MKQCLQYHYLLFQKQESQVLEVQEIKEKADNKTQNGIIDIEDTIRNEENEENMINKALDKKRFALFL